MTRRSFRIIDRITLAGLVLGITCPAIFTTWSWPTVIALGLFGLLVGVWVGLFVVMIGEALKGRYDVRSKPPEIWRYNAPSKPTWPGGKTWG